MLTSKPWRPCAAFLLSVLAGAAALYAADEPIQVRYRSAESVYLTAGAARGVSLGDRFFVVRGEETIAEIEVMFVAEHSASCRILDERLEVDVGDRVRRLPAPASGPATEEEPVPSAGAEDAGSGAPRAQQAIRSEEGTTSSPGSVSDLVLSRIERQRQASTAGRDGSMSAKSSTGGFRVRYRSADRLFIDAGQGEGLAVGDLLEVIRDGRTIGHARVTEAAAFSAASSLLAEYETIQIDDQVRLAEAAPPPANGSAELALDTKPVTPVRWKERKSDRRRHTTVRGTMNVDWETFSDRAAEERFEYGRTAGRLNLRVRDIGGLPYELRVRLRMQRNERSGPGVADSERAERRDRYYELSLTYDPPQGRYSYRVGRLSSSPFVGIGYLDGFLGQMALTSVVEVGAFAGSGSDVEELAPADSRQKYGVFARLTSPTTDSGLPWEVILAGVRELGKEGVSREFVTLQSRYAAKRWSIYQRAELDINSGWRSELAGKSSQLSNFSLTATGRLSKHGRLSLSYDLFEQYRTEETRFLPEELFNGLQRQGIRAHLQFGKPRGLNVSLNAGYRNQEGEAENTLSYGLGVRHGNIASWGLSLGLDLLGFSNQFTEGYVATLRASKRLPGDHQITLTLGDRLSRSVVFEDEPDRSTQWVRLGGWLELPRSLFANLEYEVTTGDELEGQRLSTGLGYRF